MMNINVCRIKTTNEAFNDKVHVRTLDTGQHQYEDEGGLCRGGNT